MPSPKVKALLRTQIFSYFDKSNEMQVDEAQELNNTKVDITNNDTFWVLRIHGKLQEVLKSQPGGYYRKFSHCFNKIQIKFLENDDNSYQDIEWTKQNNNADSDGFEIKRPSTTVKEIKIRIIFTLNPPLQEYKVNDELAKIIGINQDTRPRILNYLWQYIKINSLQDKENTNIILLNKDLQRLFRCDKMEFSYLTAKLSDFIKAPEPIIVDYIIKPVDDWIQNEKIFDLVVSMDNPHFLDISNFLSNTENESVLFPKFMFFSKNEQKTDKNVHNKSEKFYAKISDIDREITDLLDKLKKHKYKYDYYDAYSKDPIKFINNFKIQQNSLLKIMKDESSIIDTRWDYNSSQYYKDYEVIIFFFQFLGCA